LFHDFLLLPSAMKALTKIAGLLGLVAAVGAGAAPTPEVSGVFKGDLGLIELSTDDGRVSGFYDSGGSCGFLAGRRVLEGQFEGNVLVGSVTVCQQGAECREQIYPFLGIYNAQDGTLSGDIRLAPGCTSPALKSARLVLHAASGEERGRARRRVNLRKNAELARAALASGQRLLETHRYGEAAQQFEIGLSYDERNWVAHLGLGVAEMRRGNVHKAMGSLERSRELAKAQRQDDSSIYYNIACGHSRLGDKAAALESLGMAVEKGFAMPEAMSADPDFKPLYNEAEFKRLVSRAWDEKNRRAQAQKRGDSL
jgi:tetratricopeptide (TPR) repeat protein